MKREARLRSQHAQLYPGIAPDAWETAAILADKVLACRLLLPSSGFVLYERALNPAHFEFRGGSGPRLAAPDRLAVDPRAAGVLDSPMGATY